MTEEEIFERYCMNLNNICKQMQSTKQMVSKTDAEEALEYVKNSEFRGAGDVLHFVAAINLMNAYVKQSNNRKSFGYSFKSYIPELLARLRQKPIKNVSFCTVRDGSNNVTFVQVQMMQFSFHCVAGEKPEERNALEFDGIRKQKCAVTIYQMARANQLMRGKFPNLPIS